MREGYTAVGLVAAGGALGATGRYLAGTRLPGRRATTAVNVLGSVLFGAVTAAVAAGGPPGLGLLAGVGFCGAFTTYSAVAVELRALAGDGEWGTVARFGAGMLLAALAGAALGGWLAGIPLAGGA